MISRRFNLELTKNLSPNLLAELYGFALEAATSPEEFPWPHTASQHLLPAVLLLLPSFRFQQYLVGNLSRYHDDTVHIRKDYIPRVDYNISNFNIVLP